MCSWLLAMFSDTALACFHSNDASTSRQLPAAQSSAPSSACSPGCPRAAPGTAVLSCCACGQSQQQCCKGADTWSPAPIPVRAAWQGRHWGSHFALCLGCLLPSHLWGGSLPTRGPWPRREAVWNPNITGCGLASISACVTSPPCSPMVCWWAAINAEEWRMPLSLLLPPVLQWGTV